MLRHISILLLLGVAAAQTAAQTKPATAAKARPKLDPQRQFVVDTVRSAVAMAHGDAQDRLRVLVTAAQVVAPVDAALEKQFAHEGASLEAELIAHGQMPVASMFASGHADCALVPQFVESVPPAMAVEAEQSLLGIVDSCPKQGLAPVRQKLEAALDNGALPARALLATMERSRLTSTWSRAQFAKLFDSLPSDPEKVRSDVPAYAALLSRMANVADKDAVRDAALQFLQWLGGLKDRGARNLAVNISVDALREALGEEHYRDALAENAVARQVAETAGAAGEVTPPPDNNVSVLAAMKNVGSDRTDALAALAPPQRAREAAAHGFASGTAGDVKSADRYFDMAFAAADEVWSNRSAQRDAPAIVQEISEAAAQVDPMTALKRAQVLSDPSAQAISMLAVARVMLGKVEQGPTNTANVRPSR